MASNTRTGKDSRRGRGARWELSPGTKKALIAGVVGVLVLVLGVWAFEVLTAPPKPDLKVAKIDQVIEFLGHPRGFARMPVEKREQFLVDVAQAYSTPQRFEEMSHALAQMSFVERQQFVDGVFEIGKVKFVKASEEYARTPKKDRAQFVDHVIRDMERLRASLTATPGGGDRPRVAGGGGGPQMASVGSLASVFKEHVPTKSDAWAKAIVDRTTPAERQKAKPLADDVAKRLDQLHNDPQAKAEFARGM
jgi:hypothetical protein